MTLDEILADPPQLHISGTGGFTSWALDAEVLRYLESVLEQGMATLETGIGVSTILFSLKKTRHTSIAPWGQEHENVRRYCREHGISLTGTTLCQGRSELILPRLDPTPLDLVLIDGRHAFPSPFIDWFYTAERLVTGGLMVVDNTELRTGTILRDFMARDPHWQSVWEARITATFRKVAGGVHDGEWDRQPWMTEISSG